MKEKEFNSQIGTTINLMSKLWKYHTYSTKNGEIIISLFRSNRIVKGLRYEE